LKDAYNKALKDETARLKDPIKASFDKPITVPVRPCPPSQPMDVSGPKINLTTVVNGNGITADMAKAGQAGLHKGVAMWENTITVPTTKKTFTTTATSGTSLAKHALSMGFIATGDTGAFATKTDWTNAGKVFGRLGVGMYNNPKSTTAYRSLALKTATYFMHISVFPVAKDTTMAKCEWDITEVEFASLTSFDAPGRPGASASPDTVGAAYVAATLAATAAVVASLY